MSVTINEGTQTEVYTVVNSGTEVQVVKLDVGVGSALADFGGTIRDVANIAKGTVTRFEGGTFNAGTVVNNGGTVIVDNIQYRHPDEFATVISSGTSVLGTIRGSVAGSAIFITDIIVSAGTATNVVIASGGTSTPILGTLHFTANGGMAASNFKVYPRTVAGSALVYKQSVDGPLTITCMGYID